MMTLYGMKKTLKLSALALAISISVPLTAATTSPVFANQRVEVTVDHAKVMRVSRPAATIIIGNPGIADATVQDDQTLIITGKSFGVTNMIILDKDGQPIADTLLTVRGERVDAVTVYRRTERVTYSCSPNCERSLALGDEQTAFGNVQSQIQSRNDFANSAADN